MLIRRALLPVWCAACAVAGAFAFTVPIADPVSRIPTPIEERRMCVETLDCGSCCGNRATLRKFWACCNDGGGWSCESVCYPKKPS
jgi:hypothetical protein